MNTPVTNILSDNKDDTPTEQPTELLNSKSKKITMLAENAGKHMSSFLKCKTNRTIVNMFHYLFLPQPQLAVSYGQNPILQHQHQPNRQKIMKDGTISAAFKQETLFSQS